MVMEVRKSKYIKVNTEKHRQERREWGGNEDDAAESTSDTNSRRAIGQASLAPDADDCDEVSVFRISSGNGAAWSYLSSKANDRTVPRPATTA